MTRETDLRRLVNQEANARIAGQISMICATDARAIGLLAAAISLAGVGAAGALTLHQLSNFEARAVLVGSAWAIAAVATVAAIVAGWSIHSGGWELPGWAPGAFEQDWQKSEQEVIQTILPIAQTRIRRNTVVLELSAAKILLAQRLMLASPFAGIAGGVAALSSVWGYALLFAAIVGSGLVAWQILQIAEFARKHSSIF